MKKGETPFVYRTVLGWIERISSVPFQRFSQDLDSRWTARCEITDRLVQDYKKYFEFMKETRLNYMVQWGLFGENWPTDPRRGIPSERARRVRTVLNCAHDCGVKLLLGFSATTYGMRSFIKKFPGLAQVTSKGEKSKNVICPSKPESEKWINELLTYIFSHFDIDGLSMEPIGRCYCEDCRNMSNAEYYEMGYPKIISFVRDHFGGKTFFSCVSYHTFSNRESLDYIKKISELSDCLDADFRLPQEDIDFYESTKLKLVIRNLLRATWVTPPWSWDRLRWFLPQTIQEARSIKEAYKLGAVGYTWSSNPIANPGEEVTTRFRAGLLLDPAQKGRECLETVLREVYRPKTERALATLVEVFEAAEKAYPWDALPRVLHSESFDYLNRLGKEELSAYGKTFKKVLKNLKQVKKEIGTENKAESLITCLENVLKDVETPPTYPPEVQLRFRKIPARGREPRVS